MRDQMNTNNGGLIAARCCELARVAVANPLVSRGLADLARGHLLKIRLDDADAQFHCNRGKTSLFKGEYDAAHQDFEESIRHDPNCAIAYCFRGLACFYKNSYDKAINDFDVAIQLDPNCTLAFLFRGQTWLHKEDNDKAIRDFDEAIRLNPDPNSACATAYSRRGVAWSNKNDHDKAIKDYGKAIQFDPKDAFAYGRRGLARRETGDFDEAIKDFEEAIRLDSKDAAAFWGFSQLLTRCSDERLRNRQRAVQMMTKACKLTNWKCGTALMVLATVHAVTGQYDEAVRYQSMALQDPRYLGPAGDSVRKDLELYKQKSSLGISLDRRAATHHGRFS